MSDALIEYGSEVEREGNAGLQVLAPTDPELTAVLAGLKNCLDEKRHRSGEGHHRWPGLRMEGRDT